MIRFLFKLLFKVRHFLTKIFKSIFDGLRDPYTGKIRGIQVRNLKTLLFLAALVFFVTIFILAY